MKKLVLSLSLVASFVFAQEQPSAQELAKQNWFHVNYAKDSIYGVATDDAYAYAKSKGLKSSPVIVAVIDSGIEGDHPDLQANMWTNVKEIPGNGIDDDGNGYIDDIHGWNFIGGPNGDVDHDNTEITRLVREYKTLFESKNEAENKLNQQKYPKKYAEYQKILPEYKKELTEAQMKVAEIESQINQMLSVFEGFAKEYGGDKVIALEEVKAFTPKSKEATLLKEQILNAVNTVAAEQYFGTTANKIINELKEEGKEYADHYKGKVDYYLNLDYDPRAIVGDNYNDVNERIYGNNTIEGPDALHGTHVAGIIGAVRNNDIGMNGVAENVKIMNVRTVPDGDERDKDVANAIRYAVDNGAKVINMSFGKPYSPNKQAVWDAIKYATDHNVLLVKAAGNDDVNIDKDIHYPTNFRNGHPVSNTLLTVGASTPNNNSIKASFSNYGKQQVDIFAPGVEIYSTVPDASYKYLQGTSMASPVVAGVAALVWSYFPNLTAQEIRNILIETGNYNENLKDISTHGVVVDALKALKKAEEVSNAKGSVSAEPVKSKAEKLKKANKKRKSKKRRR
ncbi:peptidase S8 [Ornithobacterium rhinotracheale]|uniref:S8 family peptidase n=1 Tax=Ornithobacterium rhinotracheale TaxID=28251 RepID=UPI00129CBFA5|nr:S8 family peptidase [Ornithobacterium rhinotracheale]MRI63037.1 peptidase S8 [Ornithobacterium rhinotracheale]MRJ10085.1 peptidase S8 [Ornithobacterium rhinotracheale]